MKLVTKACRTPADGTLQSQDCATITGASSELCCLKLSSWNAIELRHIDGGMIEARIDGNRAEPRSKFRRYRCAESGCFEILSNFFVGF